MWVNSFLSAFAFEATAVTVLVTHPRRRLRTRRSSVGLVDRRPQLFYCRIELLQRCIGGFDSIVDRVGTVIDAHVKQLCIRWGRP